MSRTYFILVNVKSNTSIPFNVSVHWPCHVVEHIKQLSLWRLRIADEKTLVPQSSPSQSLFKSWLASVSLFTSWPPLQSLFMSWLPNQSPFTLWPLCQRLLMPFQSLLKPSQSPSTSWLPQQCPFMSWVLCRSLLMPQTSHQSLLVPWPPCQSLLTSWGFKFCPKIFGGGYSPQALADTGFGLKRTRIVYTVEDGWWMQAGPVWPQALWPQHSPRVRPTVNCTPNNGNHILVWMHTSPAPPEVAASTTDRPEMGMSTTDPPERAVAATNKFCITKLKFLYKKSPPDPYENHIFVWHLCHLIACNFIKYAKIVEK